MSNPTPSQATIIDRAFAKMASAMRVALPGRIESYDAATQKANVQPLIMESHVDDVGDRVSELPPVVTDVPIMFPGSGSYRTTWPVAVGDTVLLVFSSSSLDRWLVRGGEVDPEDDRHHNISDAVAIPGLFDFAHVPTTAPTDALVIHAPMTKIGGPGSSTPPALATELANLKALIAAWPGTGTTDGGASLKAVFASWLAPGALTVRVQ